MRGQDAYHRNNVYSWFARQPHSFWFTLQLWSTKGLHKTTLSATNRKGDDVVFVLFQEKRLKITCSTTKERSMKRSLTSITRLRERPFVGFPQSTAASSTTHRCLSREFSLYSSTLSVGGRRHLPSTQQLKHRLPNAVGRRFLSISQHSSLPLSPFEQSGVSASDNVETGNNSAAATTTTTTIRPLSKSPDEVWRQLSDKLLLNGSGNNNNKSNDNNFKSEEKSIRECIRWCSRQRPITRESQEKCWALWDRWKQHVGALTEQESKDTASDLWLTVVDHWRLALDEGAPARTPEMVWQEIRSLDQADPIKSYGILLDGLTRLGRAEDAEKLLAKLQKEGPEPSLVLWNTVLTAWARSQRPDAADRALDLLERMDNLAVEPDPISYASVLEAIAQGRESNTKDLIGKTEELFARAVNAGKVSEVAWLHRLQVWGSVDKKKARSLLYSLRNDYLAAQNNDSLGVCVPNQQLFAVVMSAFAQAGDLDSVRQLWTDLYELDERHVHEKGSSTEAPFRASPAVLNAVVQSFGRAKVPDRAEKAQVLLEAALEHSRDIVDRTSFNTLLDVWAGSRNRRNIEAVEALMDFMRQSGGPDLAPDTYTFNALLKALSRSNRRDALNQSRQVLNNMWKSFREDNEMVKPNHVSYSTILFAYSRLATPGEVKEAEKVFEELWNNYYRLNDPELCPSEASYVSLITTWIRSKRKEAASRAAYYFDHMRAKYLQTNDPRFQPSTRIYNTVIDSMKLSGDGVGAEKALKRMISDYRHGNTKAVPTTVSFNTVMTAWLKSTDRQAANRVEGILLEMEKLAKSEGWSCHPNTWSFTIVLEAWSALRSVRGAERAEAIFRGLQKQYAATKDENVRPCSHCYATVMNSWAKSGSPSAPEKTQQLFDEMMEKFESGDERLRPGAVAYVALLTAWSRSSRPDSPSRALGILNEMADRHQLDPERYEKPDSWHYSSVINAFAEQGDVLNALAVLNRVLVNHDGVRPNRGCWNGVLKAYARSGSADAPEMATEMLRQMYEYADQGYGESSPDAAVYTTLLEVWRCSGREDSFEKGLELLQEMLNQSKSRRRLLPDAGVFLLLFRLLHESKLPQQSKNDNIERLVGIMKQQEVRSTKALQKAIDECR